MNKLKALASVFCAALLALSVSVAVVAQDATATPEGGSAEGDTGMMTNCESSLILLAGLAQRYFGYTPAPDISLSNFQYGQYFGLFDMTSVDMNNMGTEGDTTEVGSETTPVPTLETAATPEVFLTSPVIADEDPACTQLRFDLEAFFSNEFMTQDWDQRFRNGMSGGMGDNTGDDMMETTPDMTATPSS